MPNPRRREDKKQHARKNDNEASCEVDRSVLGVLQSTSKAENCTAFKILIVFADIRFLIRVLGRLRLWFRLGSWTVLGRRRTRAQLLGTGHVPARTTVATLITLASEKEARSKGLGSGQVGRILVAFRICVDTQAFALCGFLLKWPHAFGHTRCGIMASGWAGI